MSTSFDVGCYCDNEKCGYHGVLWPPRPGRTAEFLSPPRIDLTPIRVEVDFGDFHIRILKRLLRSAAIDITRS
ncbi:hypothetical protein SAMN05216562_2534 [Microbulbifer marinus]|uniref:Uncharacterized protein n=1 Tax=Microbulbifer marinus TaxID=658218 RepID=A0A1H4A3J6_9GAMM|nr:hypothetical protein SAMN05216562_2534 [Microbulbifer marinus]